MYFNTCLYLYIYIWAIYLEPIYNLYDRPCGWNVRFEPIWTPTRHFSRRTGGKLRELSGSYTWSFYVFIVMAFLASCHYAALELGKKKTLQATKSMMFKSRESSCKGGVPKVG